MRYFVAIIITLTICCCKTNTPKEDTEAVFSPGLVEGDLLNMETVDSIKKPDSINKIPSSDYLFLSGLLSNPKMETTFDAQPPFIFIKFNSIRYILGKNRVIETENKKFIISEFDDYKIKCIIHFYNFIDKESLELLPEIKRFSMPADHQFIPSVPHKPNRPFVKIVLQEQSCTTNKELLQ